MSNLTTSGGLSQRTNVYAAARMLAHAMPVMVLEKVATPYRMPQNKSQSIVFRRPVSLDAKTVPLVEGVTPSMSSFSYEDVTATLKQYGDVLGVTDVIADTHEDPVLNDMTMMSGENIGRTMEALNWAVVRGGTNVVYANGASRAAVNSVLTKNKQRAATRALKAQKAKKIRQILSPSPNYETRAIESAYIAIAHTDLEADIRNLTGFVPTAEYGTRSVICEEEIGAVEDVRYVLSPDLGPWENAGGTASTNSTKTTGGTNSDVYPIMIFGQESFGTVALRGKGAITPSIIPPNNPSSADPLGQRGYVGWKGYHAAVRLNELWMVRVEVAVSAL